MNPSGTFSQEASPVQTVTHLNWMTLLCWLNLVMTDTSMNGFGSEESRDGDSESDMLKTRKESEHSSGISCKDTVRMQQKAGGSASLKGNYTNFISRYGHHHSLLF